MTVQFLKATPNRDIQFNLYISRETRYLDSLIAIKYFKKWRLGYRKCIITAWCLNEGFSIENLVLIRLILKVGKGWKIDNIKQSVSRDQKINIYWYVYGL